MSDNAVDIGLIARQQRQIMSDMGSLKDDMGVMMAILMRLGGTLSQQSLVSNRLRALETASSGPSP